MIKYKCNNECTRKGMIPKMNSAFFKEFFKVFKVARKEFIYRFIDAVFIRGFLLILPILLSYIIGSISKNEISKAVILVIASIFVTALYRVFECLGSRDYHRLYKKIYSYYNSLAIDKTNENSVFSLSRFTLGQYSNMLTTDVDTISAFFSNLVLRFVQILEFLVIYVYFFSIDKVLFITVILLSIVILYLIPKTNHTITPLNNKRKEEQDKQVVATHEYFLTTKEIKSFNLFDIISSKTKKQTHKYLEANAKYINRYDYNNHAFLLSIEIVRLLSILYSIHLVTVGKLGIEMILIIYNYYQKIVDNFSTILTINVDLTNFGISLQRFNHLLEFSKPKSKFPYKIDESVFKGEICFEKILYGYRHDPILNGVSFRVRPNSISVITGKDSSGKVGISNLLLKFNQQHEGTITIDGINIQDIPDDDYFKMISLVREQPVFFNASIKENLIVIENDFEKVKKICKELGIDDEISSLPKGYDTMMDANITISTSTKQMIAIARVLLKDSKILVFDEALGVLDENSQNIIMEKLKKLKVNHTILIISHDKNVLKEAERIIVLDEHKVAEIGTVKELVEQKGKYFEMFEAQSA